ncbi:cell envelope integrity protein TolA [Vibrio sp.]|uniref:cell envelope integrity protein TolA n=1 Tax=Vibrio sp. TaxID=678 RepID=UPI003AA9D5D1
MLNKEYKSAILISVVLHIILFVLFLGGAWFSDDDKKPKHQMVEAVVIDPKAIEKQAKSIRDQRDAAKKAEQQRVEKLRQQAELLEKNRKKEEERLRKLQEQKVQQEKQAREAEKQKQLAEKQRQEAQEKARIEKQRAAKAEAERKAKEAAAAKVAAEKKAAEQAKAAAEAKAAAQAKAKADAKAKAEAEKRAKEKAQQEAAEKARLAREKEAQEAALNDIFSGLEAESAQISSARQKYVASELDRYGAIYKQMIQEKLLTEDSFRGKSCKINIRLVQTGSDAIVSKVTPINGESAVCSAAKRAIAQVGNFPMSKEQDVADQLKNINLVVDL